MKKHHTKRILSTSVLSAVLLSSTAMAHQQPPAVPAMTVATSPVHFEKTYVGRVTPVDHVQIATKVPGEIQTVNFQEGSFVTAGDVLFTLDPEPYELALESAKATLKAAKAQHENAMLTLARSEKLIETNAISEQELLDQQAHARVQAANVAQAEVAIKHAALNLRYTQIVAPVSGRIGAKRVSVGDLVGTEPPVRVMTDIMVLDPVNLVMNVTERDLLNSVAEHSELELTLANGDVYPATGTVNFVDNSISAHSGTIKVRASFPNPDNQLVPGLFATVNATDTRTQNLITVPQRAVMENQSGRYVYVADAEQTVQVRPVQTGARIGTQWVIDEGLSEGDIVLTSNLQLLRPGQTVSVEMAGEA